MLPLQKSSLKIGNGYSWVSQCSIPKQEIFVQFGIPVLFYYICMKKYIALIPKNNLKEGRKKKSVIILAASVLAAVGSHKKERKNIYEYKLGKYGRSERRLKYKH